MLRNDAGVSLDAARGETLRLLGTEMPQGDGSARHSTAVGASAIAPEARIASVAMQLRRRDGSESRHEFDRVRDAIHFLETVRSLDRP